jgi:hypothetical protein
LQTNKLVWKYKVYYADWTNSNVCIPTSVDSSTRDQVVDKVDKLWVFEELKKTHSFMGKKPIVLSVLKRKKPRVGGEVKEAVAQWQLRFEMAEVAPVTVSNEREINPLQLSLEQLNSLKGQHEEELQQLQRQGETLIGAKNRFLTVKSTLNDLQQSKVGDRLLIPLNSSLYVPGTMVEPEKVNRSIYKSRIEKQ